MGRLHKKTGLSKMSIRRGEQLPGIRLKRIEPGPPIR